MKLKNNIIKKIEKSILFYTILYLILYISIEIILGLNNLTYLRWIKTFSICFIVLGFIIGTIQEIVVGSKTKNEEKKIVFSVLLPIEIFLAFIIIRNICFWCRYRRNYCKR